MGYSKKKNILLIVAAAFPYGSGETFLESELEYHYKNFDEVIIFCSKKGHGTRVKINSDVKVEVFKDINPKLSFSLIFNIKTITEIFRYVFSKIFHFSFLGIKEIVNYLLIAKQKAKQIENYVIDKKIKNENLILYSTWMSDSSLAIAFLSQKHKLKSVCRAHRYDLYEEENQFSYLPFRNIIVKRLDRIYFISQDGLDYFRDKYKNNSKLKLARLGVRSQELSSNQNNNKLIILSCAFVLQQKRLELIIESISNISEIEIKWIHIGDTRDDNYWNILKKLASNKFKSKQNLDYEFLGYMSNREILDFYKKNNIDLFINLSTSEGIPIAMMEAFSFGVPIIATNVGGVSELIKDNKNGFLLNSQPSVFEVRDAIMKFASNDKNQKVSFKKNAKETFQNSYNASTNYSKFSQDLKTLFK